MPGATGPLRRGRERSDSRARLTEPPNSAGRCNNQPSRRSTHIILREGRIQLAVHPRDRNVSRVRHAPAAAMTWPRESANERDADSIKCAYASQTSRRAVYTGIDGTRIARAGQTLAATPAKEWTPAADVSYLSLPRYGARWSEPSRVPSTRAATESKAPASMGKFDRETTPVADQELYRARRKWNRQELTLNITPETYHFSLIGMAPRQNVGNCAADGIPSDRRSAMSRDPRRP